MASAMPGNDLIIQPHNKIFYNGPFSEKKTENVHLTNNGAHRIGWAIKTTNSARLNVTPASGVLDRRETVVLTITCEPIDYGTADTSNDRLEIEWTKAPFCWVKTFRCEWFEGQNEVICKTLHIEYNP